MERHARSILMNTPNNTTKMPYLSPSNICFSLFSSGIGILRVSARAPAWQPILLRDRCIIGTCHAKMAGRKGLGERRKVRASV